MKLHTELKDWLTRYKFGWFGQRALDCIGLDRFLDFELILCCDYGSDTELVSSRTGARVVSLERETAIREKWSNFSLEELFEGKAASRVSAVLLSQRRNLDIVAYCSTEGLEKLIGLSNGKVRILAAHAFLKRFFDNKITLRAVLPALGIRPVPGHVVRLGVPRFREIERAYGVPFVVQFPIGASGSHTFFVFTEADFASLQDASPHEDVVVSKYIQGVSPNVNAVVLDNAILLSYPSIQLIGVQECTNWPAGYCGNDFSATQFLPDSTIQGIHEQARRIGNWLRQHGFRGLFGVDFVADESGVYPVEVNPRFQGSTHVLTQTQVMRDQVPLALAHVLEFLKDDERVPFGQLPSWWGESEPLNGAQMILHSKESIPRVVRGMLGPGIYTLGDDAVAFRREGLSLIDCQDEEEFVVTCAIPKPGTRVEPGAPLLKIQTLRGVLDMRTRALQPWASKACEWAYDALALS